MDNKQIELKKAKKILKEFCLLNNIKTPRCIIDNTIDEFGVYYTNNISTIFINLDKCKLSNSKLTHGSIKEYTIIGVLIHEFAHLLHYQYHYDVLHKSFKKLKEPLIHYFERDIEEDIAESIRLFILNPTLLEEGRPKRYKILNKLFKTINTEHYIVQLERLNTQNRIMTQKWILGEI